MLVRAARRTARPSCIRTYEASCEQLYLPWLCPAYSETVGRRYITSEIKPRAAILRKRRNSGDHSALEARRSLATAVDFRPSDDSLFDEIPFDDSVNRGVIFKSLSKLKPWDPSRTLMVNDSLAMAPIRHNTIGGVGGEAVEILSVLEACLKVGRLERAGFIIKRLGLIKALGPEQMVSIHNEYLEAYIDKIIGYPNASSTQNLHKWFEMEIRHKSLPLTSETLACMVKVSLQSPPGARQDRLVRRYMNMASEEARLDILHSEILTAEEVQRITQISTTFTVAVTEELEEEMYLDEPLEKVVLQSGTDTVTSALRSPVPEVLAVEQKGMGLRTLKESLSLFSKKPEGFDTATLDTAARRKRQTRLEEDAVTAALNRWREESAQLTKMGLDPTLNSRCIGARMWKWHGALSEYLEEEMVKIDEAEAKPKKCSEDNDRCTYGPFLRYLPTDKLAAVTILATMSTLSSMGMDKGISLASGILSLAKSVEEESMTETILKQGGKKNSQSETFPKDAFQGHARKGKQPRMKLSDNLWKLVSEAGQQESEKIQVWDSQWSIGIKTKIGSFLLGALIKTAKIPVTRIHPTTNEALVQIQPAFTHGYQYKMGRKLGVVLANPVLVAQMKREPVHSLLAKHLPMITEPEPWTRFDTGGFILHPAKMMRIKDGDKDQRHYAEAAISNGDMDQMFKGLDVLGKTAWKINRPVFDVMLEVWNSGEAVGKIAPSNPELISPSEPMSHNDPTERRKWLRAVKLVENQRSGFHSQRCFQNFQLEIARAFLDETFYFPHNVDFRGRAYPIPPYLNHMGADHARGLLRFGKGKELGPGGLRWLKIHLSNVFGFDKASLKEREEFHSVHWEAICESVTNPLGESRWWLQAEDPWQCLAACHELKAAMDSPDPTKFISHLPIHQDGTCNGLQHYAALGGDEGGAKQVNLTPGDRPADVYSAVAELVKESIVEDKANGNPVAAWLDGKITRKTVKQTVMTNVYGVTFVGAKDQVRKQLKAAHPEMPTGTDVNISKASSYTALKIFSALSTMFRGAHDIQYWLAECADRISMALTAEQLTYIQDNIKKSKKASKSRSAQGRTAANKDPLETHLQFKSSVIWTNPLRMPVVQPYRSSVTRTITTNLQKVAISEQNQSDPVNKRKQLQAFPPNFVHSLDATHMILSALRCDELGLSFAAVHDSFWTHAGDIEAMNNVLRDAFIRIHSEDVIGRLAAEFRARYSGSVFLGKIKPTSALGKKIKALRTANRKVVREVSGQLRGVRIQELLDEGLRRRLLTSSDPADVEKGTAMVTPGSIFEELGELGESGLASGEDLTNIGLGEIPTKGTTISEEAESMLAADLDEIVDLEEDEIDVTRDAEMEAVQDAMPETQTRKSEDPAAASSAFERMIAPKEAKVASQKQYIYAWLPMKFPAVPRKGTFDVSKLRDSQYFFS